MYCLKQASVLAYNILVKSIAPRVYTPCKYSTVIWWYDTKETKLCLCVDYFGVKYFSGNDPDHLLSSLFKNITKSPCTLKLGTTVD